MNSIYDLLGEIKKYLSTHKFIDISMKWMQAASTETWARLGSSLPLSARLILSLPQPLRDRISSKPTFTGLYSLNKYGRPFAMTNNRFEDSADKM